MSPMEEALSLLNGWQGEAVAKTHAKMSAMQHGELFNNLEQGSKMWPFYSYLHPNSGLTPPYAGQVPQSQWPFGIQANAGGRAPLPGVSPPGAGYIYDAGNKLPVPFRGGPPSLPPGGAGLPAAAGGSNLPVPYQGGGLPATANAPGLPATQGGLGTLAGSGGMLATILNALKTGSPAGLAAMAAGKVMQPTPANAGEQPQYIRDAHGNLVPNPSADHTLLSQTPPAPTSAVPTSLGQGMGVGAGGIGSDKSSVPWQIGGGSLAPAGQPLSLAPPAPGPSAPPAMFGGPGTMPTYNADGTLGANMPTDGSSPLFQMLLKKLTQG